MNSAENLQVEYIPHPGSRVPVDRIGVTFKPSYGGRGEAPRSIYRGYGQHREGQNNVKHI